MFTFENFDESIAHILHFAKVYSGATITKKEKSVGFVVMNDDCLNDKVIPFPNLPLRLLDKGSNLLMEGKIREAIPYLEEAEKLEPENPDILYTLISAYLEQGNFTKAKIILEEMVHKGIGDYFETVEIYMTVLFQLHEYKKITTMLTMLLDEEQVPLEKIEQYKELLELSKKLANGNNPSTSDVHINLFEDDLKTTIHNLENLDRNGFARHLLEFKEYLESTTGNPFLKTILLNVLRENHYDKKVVVKKFNQTVQVNIQSYADVQNTPFSRKVKEKLEALLIHENPSLLAYAITLTERFFFMIYPLEMNFSHLDLWVTAILLVVEDYFDDQHTDNISNLVEVEMKNEELLKAIDFITEVEQQFCTTTQ